MICRSAKPADLVDAGPLPEQICYIVARTPLRKNDKTRAESVREPANTYKVIRGSRMRRKHVQE